MWMARLAVAAGEAPDGETATSVILADLGVQQALEQVRHDPSSWERVMLSPEARRTMFLENIQRSGE
jgi:hypothetical protein